MCLPIQRLVGFKLRDINMLYRMLNVLSSEKCHACHARATPLLRLVTPLSRKHAVTSLRSASPRVATRCHACELAKRTGTPRV